MDWSSCTYPKTSGETVMLVIRPLAVALPRPAGEAQRENCTCTPKQPVPGIRAAAPGAYK